MKNTILSLLFITCLPVYNCMAQPAAGGGTAHNEAPPAARETSNFSPSQTYTNNTPARTVPVYNTSAQETNNRSSVPAANSGTTNTINNNRGSLASSQANIGNRPNSPSSVYYTNTTMRYNYAAKKTYRYYSSAYTKSKSRKHNSDGLYIYRPSHLGRPLYYISDYAIAAPYEYTSDDLLLDNTPSIPDNSAMGASFDGYVVYGQDTLSGVVTLSDKSVFLEQPVDSTHEYGSTLAFSDTALKTIAVFNGYKELYLTKLSSNDTKLHRVIHAGMLNIYDDHYNFLSPDNIDKSRITVSYNNKIETPHSFMAMDGKQLIISSINRVYGIKLQSGISWQKLLLYIDKLN